MASDVHPISSYSIAINIHKTTKNNTKQHKTTSKSHQISWLASLAPASEAKKANADWVEKCLSDKAEFTDLNDVRARLERLLGDAWRHEMFIHALGSLSCSIASLQEQWHG
jgi:hypothetical protein